MLRTQLTVECGSHGPEVQVVDRHVACVMTADDTVRAAVRRLYRHALGDNGSGSASESESESESGSGTTSAVWQLSADQHMAVAQMLQCACAEVQHGTAGGLRRSSESSIKRAVEADVAAAGDAGSAVAGDHDQQRVSAETQLQNAQVVLSQRTGRFVLVLECVADQGNRCVCHE